MNHGFMVICIGVHGWERNHHIKSSHRYSCSYFIFVPNLVDYGFFPMSFCIHVFSNTS